MDSINYSSYSIDELLEVKQNISPDSTNFPALVAEIEKRRDEIEHAQEQAVEDAFLRAEDRVKAVGYFQLAGAAAITLIIGYQMFDTGISLTTLLVSILLITLNIAAGYTAIKEMVQYYWLSILNQALQVVSVAVGNTSANYSGLGGIYATVEWSEGFKFAVSANFSPGFSFLEYSTALPVQSISIDVLAIVFIGAIITVMDGKAFFRKTKLAG